MTRRRGAAALVAVALAVLIAVAAFGLLERGAERGGLAARPAEEFTDSVGVNVHMTFRGTAYARFPEWSARLRELGVRHVRDALTLDDQGFVDQYRELAASGIRASFFVGRTDRPPSESVALAAGALRPAVASLEGPNEPENFGGDDWEATLRRFLPQLRGALDARPDLKVPLLGPSLIRRESRRAIADLAPTWDAENLHPYVEGRPPADRLREIVAGFRALAPGRPAYVTETGFHNALSATSGQPPVPEDVAADYLPVTLAEAFAVGIGRTFLYELIDPNADPERRDPEKHFGLLRTDGSPKPAFHAVRNLMRLVRTPVGDGDRRPVEVAAPAGVRTQVLDHGDGSRLLLLWRSASRWDAVARRPEEAAAVTARVSFEGEAEEISVHRPSRDERPVRRQDEAGRLRVDVGPDLVAISFR